MGDRIKDIYHLLENHKSMTVEELAEILAVSKSTIRRELSSMEAQDMIIRHYGGASLSNSQIKEKSNNVKNLYNSDEKKVIARLASTLVKDGDIVYLDGGTTTSSLVDYIGNKDVLIVTQAVNLFDKLLNKKAKVLVLSGYLKPSTNMIVGTNTIEEMRKLRFDISFIGGNSINETFGYSASDDVEAFLKNEIISNSNKAYVLADSSKINILTYPKFADLKDCGLITEKLVKGFNYNLIPEVYYYEDDKYTIVKHMVSEGK